MRKLVVMVLLLVVGFGIVRSMDNTCPIPQFTDEENEMICIEEGIY